MIKIKKVVDIVNVSCYNKLELLLKVHKSSNKYSQLNKNKNLQEEKL